MSVNRQIFREYDIRGEVAADLPTELVVRLGRAFAGYCCERGGHRLVLGRDMRSTSDRLRSDLLEGLLAGGMEVTDLGVCPTPALYFGSLHLGADAGVMITGSHNPPAENGFKLLFDQRPVYGAEIRKILASVESDLSGRVGSARGSVTEIRLLDKYQSGLRARLKPVSRRLRVVVDCGNGTAGPVAIPLYEALGCEVVPLFAEPDGSFPNHHPDPTVAENLSDLSRVVCRGGADLGLAFDGDSDRLGAVDERGKILWGDDLLTIFARAVLEEHPGATVIGDVKCSGRLFSDVKERGGRAIMWKSGHSLIKAKAREEGALLAGEWSGHFCFADRFFGFDDGIYAGGRLIEVCGRGSVPCSGLLEDLAPVCSVPEIRLDCPDPVKFAVMDRLIAHFSDRYDTITLDGVRIVTDGAWALIRASNTQPVLVLRYEASSAERLEALRTSVEEKVLETIKASLSGDSQCSTS